MKKIIIAMMIMKLPYVKLLKNIMQKLLVIGKKYLRRNIMKTFRDYDIDLEEDGYDDDWDDEIYED